MILALKTSDELTQMWLYPATDTIDAVATASWESGRTLADGLLAHLMSFLAEHGQSPQTLTGIVIYSGPGSFTSLRIGHTVANALADSLQIPVTNATGQNWAGAALKALSNTSPGHPAMPYYGTEANITRPKT